MKNRFKEMTTVELIREKNITEDFDLKDYLHQLALEKAYAMYRGDGNE